jgi:hypothetical protein
VLVIDYLVYHLLFSRLLFVLIIVSSYVDVNSHIGLPRSYYDHFTKLVHSLGRVAVEWVLVPWFPFVLSGTITFTFFWAGFAPSLWVWLYVAALFVTRAILRSEKLVNRLRWFLDVEKNPFRSIGAVAAALAFIASVAILLISAEGSRISGAA